jgi:hypothetical protein
MLILKDSQGKKQRKIIMVPAVRNYIYQPNRVTNAVYVYSLIQERLLNALIFYLQEAIKERMGGHDYTNLALFKDFKAEQIYRFKIPLKEISTPQNYAHVKESIKKLASIVVEIPYRDEQTKKQMLRYTGLIRVNVPRNNERTSNIEVEIEKKVANLLIEIDLNKKGIPVNYTRFEYQIAQNASSKYTSRIYKLLCSWRNKGGFVMRLDDFRQWLGIEDKYKYYNDIKKHILLPVQQELFKKADCWFNCEDAGFALKNGNSVTQLNFKVITLELIEQEGKQIDQIKYLLRTYYHFTEKHLDALKPILCSSNAQGIITKLLFLSEYISDNIDNITDIPNYIIKTLQNEFEICPD